ncbi:Regulator of RpoS [Candidatus Magnetaquicoccaceae bacterium FCR-1]|uniref:Regulator of RpoS n=2 Tax=Candidatus Magnetaquiglobus chichijimensis TaxID=3141448 RepID=A0ABQ0C7N7_9PROT
MQCKKNRKIIHTNAYQNRLKAEHDHTGAPAKGETTMLDDSFRQMGRTYQPGEIIYRQGDPAEHFHVIQRGSVIITRETATGQTLLVESGDGEVFGIVSLFLAGRRRFSTARAAVESVIMSVDAKIFMARLHQDPSIAFRVIRHLSQRIHDLDLALPATQRGRLNVHDFSVGHHFLVVEDEIEFFSLITAWLKHDDKTHDSPCQLGSCKLTHAWNRHEAETLLGLEKFDLILLDLNLPDSHGYAETFVQIHERALDTPIIVFTGMDDDQQAVQAVNAGAQDYLIKGEVSRRAFHRAILHALSRHDQYRKTLTEAEVKTENHVERFSFNLFDWSVKAEHRLRA